MLSPTGTNPFSGSMTRFASLIEELSIRNNKGGQNRYSLHGSLSPWFIMFFSAGRCPLLDRETWVPRYIPRRQASKERGHTCPRIIECGARRPTSFALGAPRHHSFTPHSADAPFAQYRGVEVDDEKAKATMPMLMIAFLPSPRSG
jgi:hypothetical protein